MNRGEILTYGYLMGYMDKTANDKPNIKGKSLPKPHYPKPDIKGKSVPKPKKGYTGPPSKPSTPAEANDASNDANDLVDPDIRKKVNKAFQKAAADVQLPGQGMGQMQPATGGFPLNAEMAAAQQEAGGADQQAMMEEEQKRQQQEEELKQLEEAKLDTAHEAKKTQMAKDIYQNQQKIKKSQEDMVKAQVDQQNQEALSSMISNSSPGE